MDKFKNLAEKILANSVWPVYSPNVFYMYSKENAEKVTEEGKKAMRKIIKYFDK